MKSIPQQTKAPDEKAKPGLPEELPGVIPARDGLQPVADLAAFLRSLPDFGPDAARLREAIAEDRALRRAAVKEEGC